MGVESQKEDGATDSPVLGTHLAEPASGQLLSPHPAVPPCCHSTPHPGRVRVSGSGLNQEEKRLHLAALEAPAQKRFTEALRRLRLTLPTVVSPPLVHPHFL